MSFRQILLVALLLSNLACQGDAMPKAETIKFYYGSFAGYAIPLKPVEPLSEQEALGRSSYCVAQFEQNKLVVFERYVEGNLFFQHKYSYFPNGRVSQSRVTNADGIVRVQNYDP